MTILAVPKTEAGESRHIGLELEYLGVGLEKSSALIVETFGGKVEQIAKYRYQIPTDEYGTFVVELDQSMMQKLSAHYMKEDEQFESHMLEEAAETLLSPFTSRLSPFEIITPPMEERHIEKMELLVTRLQDAGALGTKASPIHAFGLHINVETPSLKPETILAYIQSFLLLYDWLVKRMEVDITRRLTSYANPFPESYATKALRPDYQPQQKQLIDDYLEDNPTRNRALDMLPLFAHLDKERVMKAVHDSRIKSRPAFHFRLPNSRVDEPGWTLHRELENWAIIERLANNNELREEMCKAYLADRERFLHYFDTRWEHKTAQWINALQ
jgi:hypothetical protein